MNGIKIRGKVDGKFRGISPLTKPNKFKHKTLNKVVDYIPLPMYDLIGVVYAPLRNIEVNKDFEATHSPLSLAVKIERSLIECPHKVVQGKCYETVIVFFLQREG